MDVNHPHQHRRLSLKDIFKDNDVKRQRKLGANRAERGERAVSRSGKEKPNENLLSLFEENYLNIR